MLYVELLRSGFVMPEFNSIDVYKLVQTHEQSKKLTSVYARYFAEKIINAHDAESDCLATKRIYEFLQKNKGIESSI